jgi:proteasome lid subunit RPN8/RPN11
VATWLSEAHLRHIQAHGSRDFPHECCGILLGTAKGDEKRVLRTVAMTNTHEDGHERRYLISPLEMLRVEKEARAEGLLILGTYHSHPNHPAVPSDYDREWAWPWYTYIILSVMGGIPAEMTAWTLLDDRSSFQEEPIHLMDAPPEAGS